MKPKIGPLPCLLKLLIPSLLMMAASMASADYGIFSGVSTKGNLSVWRINQTTGAVSLCSFEGNTHEPTCYPWSAVGEQGKYLIIAGTDVLSTWRINAATGAVSLCEYDDVEYPPVCTPWSRQ